MEHINTIILAAGSGTRLLPHTLDKPKCLINIHERSILEWQVKHLTEIGLKNFTIITGYKHKLIKKKIEYLRTIYPNTNIELVYNLEYQNTENINSCFMGLKYHLTSSLLINGDVLFPPYFVKNLIRACSEDIALLYDVKKEYDADDMKILINKNKLEHVSKDIDLLSADGESIGILFLTSKGAQLLFHEIRQLLKTSSNKSLWFLRAIDRLAQIYNIQTVRTPNSYWCEIDYPKDLQTAHELFRNYTLSKEIKYEQTAACY